MSGYFSIGSLVSAMTPTATTITLMTMLSKGRSMKVLIFMSVKFFSCDD